MGLEREEERYMFIAGLHCVIVKVLVSMTRREDDVSITVLLQH